MAKSERPDALLTKAQVRDRMRREGETPPRPSLFDYLVEKGLLRRYPANPVSTSPRQRWLYDYGEFREARRKLVAKPRSARELSEDEAVAQRALARR